MTRGNLVAEITKHINEIGNDVNYIKDNTYDIDDIKDFVDEIGRKLRHIESNVEALEQGCTVK